MLRLEPNDEVLDALVEQVPALPPNHFANAVEALSVVSNNLPPESQKEFYGWLVDLVREQGSDLFNRLLSTGRNLSQASQASLYAALVSHFLSCGFAEDLRGLKGAIASQPEPQRADVLAAKNSYGAPGLTMALQNGHAEAIKAYGELLPLISESQRAKLLDELLAAKRHNGTSRLTMALQSGHVQAIRAFGELLPLFPEPQRTRMKEAMEAVLGSRSG